MNKEEDVNLIALLKEALKFYANKENYLFFKDKDAPIAIDEGHQARFALNQIEKLDEINKKIESDYDGMINDVKKENNIEDMYKTIYDLKNIVNED